MKFFYLALHILATIYYLFLWIYLIKSKANNITILAMTFFTGLLIYSWVFWFRTYQNQDYRIEGDYIIHKKYGKYPKVVPFKKGMTLYPQQQARVKIENPELGKIYTIDENGKQKEVGE